MAIPARACHTCTQEYQPRRSDQRYCGTRCKVWANDLSSRFGITPAQYYERLASQEGLCAACDKPFGENRPALDHCHASGKVRGFLHTACNCALGSAKDDQETLFAWQVYLARHQFDLRDLCAA